MLFDIDARLVRRAVRALRRAAGVPARGPAQQRPIRDHRSRRGRRARGPGQRHRGRPAGRALRAGVLRAGDDQEHLRHRVVRARQPGRRAPGAGRRPADDRGVAARRRGHLRDGGLDLRDRRRDPVAARRPRHHRRRGRGRAARRERARHRRRGVRPRVHRARLTVVGPVRAVGFSASRAARAHVVRAVVEAMAWQTADVVDAITAASGPPDHRAARRRRRQRDGRALPVPGRRARRHRAPPGRAGRPPRSAPPTSRDSRKACGRRPPRPPRRGPPTRRSHRRCRATNAIAGLALGTALERSRGNRP